MFYIPVNILSFKVWYFMSGIQHKGNVHAMLIVKFMVRKKSQLFI